MRLGTWTSLALLALSAATRTHATVELRRPDGPGNDDYQAGADSRPEPGVPAGEVFDFAFDRPAVFPGTSRTISVYVPAQYRGDGPACVYVGFDGLRFEATNAFDHLIQRGEIPVLIAIGISPGQVDSARAPEDPRYNRSFEYDSLNDSMARFILDELLPEVERHQTSRGLPIRLSRNPDDRCIAGASSGAIAAFTAAWERPDAFHRVFSAIGTYVGMRGGDRYPVLVRKTEPKPIRIYLQDGENDQWMGGPGLGDWWMSNRTLERALAFAGYQVAHSWGTGVHSDRHPTAIFPEAMRWLWKDWPQPVTAGQSQNLFLQDVLLPGEPWHEVSGSFPQATMMPDRNGDVWVGAGDKPTLDRIGVDGVVEDTAVPATGTARAVGPDGRRYAVDRQTGVVSVQTGNAAPIELTRDIRGERLVVTSAGNLYLTEADRLWLVSPDGAKRQVADGLHDASGVALSPDGLWLAVAERSTHWGRSFRVRDDGTLDAGQRFYWFHVPDTAECSGASAWCADRDGRLYAATTLGVQVFDRNGRVRAILPVPGGAVTDVCFGGRDFRALYVAAGGKIYRRTLRPAGAPAWLKPIVLPPWGVG